MVEVAIGLGSNQGDRLAHLRHALNRMKGLATGPVLTSRCFETAPINCFDPDPYLNACALFDTTLTAEALLEALLEMERELDRRRPYPNAPRTIDLDVLLYGHMIRESKALTLPHPRMHLRRFVLEPLAEIAPRKVHPCFGKTVAQLLQGLPPADSRTWVRPLDLPWGTASEGDNDLSLT